MKRKLVFLLCVLCLIAALPISVSADMGPKPSVRVRFRNMGEELCYGTLLSSTPSTGPASVWDGNEDTAYYKGSTANPSCPLEYDIWKAFVDYRDADGYYFLQTAVSKVSETGEIAWTYYPPQRFKILLYYPESGRFAISGICERYAFDTYYTVDMSGAEIGSVEYDRENSTDARIDAYRSYEWRQELLSLFARILITIVIEMGVAFLFGFFGKKAVLLLLVVNTVTQIALNVLLNVINYHSGQAAFVVWYILMELLIFAAEAVVYAIWLRKFDSEPRKRWFYVLYALVANAASFATGLLISHLLPGIF